MAKNTTKVARVIESTNKKYELMIVLQPEMLESAVEKKLREFDKFLAENGGTVDMKDNWGKQKLAYRIGKHGEGIYVVYNITFPTTECRELDEHLRIDKDIIRYLQTGMDEGYEYRKYEAEAPKMEKREAPARQMTSHASHKAAAKEPMKSEVKDKGVKADAGTLDDKLDKLLEGDDINI